MMKSLLVVSAVSLAALSFNARAHPENEVDPAAKAAPMGAAHHVDNKAPSHGAGHMEAHAPAFGKPGNVDHASRTVELDMNDKMRFSPSQITAKRGETIRFVVKNSGKMKHEMVLLGSVKELNEHAAMMRKMPQMEHADDNMVVVEPGKSRELVWQFTKTGKFNFACLQPGHFEAGMKGKVAVK